MTLAEGSGIIADGINVLKTPIGAIDNLSVWQIFIAFLVFDVIAWGIVKIIRGRAMHEGAVQMEGQISQEEIDEMVDNAESNSFAYGNDDTWSND